MEWPNLKLGLPWTIKIVCNAIRVIRRWQQERPDKAGYGGFKTHTITIMFPTFTKTAVFVIRAISQVRISAHHAILNTIMKCNKGVVFHVLHNYKH
jgi:hypothetical protein